MNKYGQTSVSTFLLCFLVTSTQIKLMLRLNFYMYLKYYKYSNK